MLTQQDELRAINLADAASRATTNGQTALAEKLEKHAMRLLDGLAEVPHEFTRHEFIGDGFKDENGQVLRNLYVGTVVYIQRSRP